jgi:hypothetical protein
MHTGMWLSSVMLGCSVQQGLNRLTACNNAVLRIYLTTGKCLVPVSRTNVGVP